MNSSIFYFIWTSKCSFRACLNCLCLTKSFAYWLRISDLPSSFVLFKLLLMNLTLIPRCYFSTFSHLDWLNVCLKLLYQFRHIFSLLLWVEQSLDLDDFRTYLIKFGLWIFILSFEISLRCKSLNKWFVTFMFQIILLTASDACREGDAILTCFLFINSDQ